MFVLWRTILGVQLKTTTITFGLRTGGGKTQEQCGLSILGDCPQGGVQKL